MDPAQGDTQGKSLTSKLKAKVKGVKGKVHLPGHKKRQAGDARDGSSSSSDDDSPQKPGPETGYNLGNSTPYTTVKNTPLSPPPHESHDRDYEPPSPPPTMEEENDHSHQTDQQPYATSTTEGMSAYSEPPSSPSQASPGILGQVKQSMGGAAAAVGSKMGYYTEVEGTPHVQAPHDPNAPTMMDKTKAALGMDKPSDPNAPTMMEKTKAAMGMDKPTDPNAPTMMEKTKATLGLGPNTTSPSTNQQPGIVDRVSGAVSSLFNSSPKETGENMQHTFPAQSDDVPKAAGHGVEDEKTTFSSPAYKTNVN